MSANLCNPGLAKAMAIAREVQCKAKARRYDAWTRQQGLSQAEARLLAPADVRSGQAIRKTEERKRQQAALRAKKEAIAQRFG